MSEYRFSDASAYTFAQLSELHNASFAGYFFPMTMTTEMTADFWRVNQIDANRCVVMHNQAGTFVGMARMGTRGNRSWCGGFGIVPQLRGIGASNVLAAQMVQVARDSGLATLQLEVLTQNVRAIKTYEHAGLTITRKLCGLEMSTQALPEGAPLHVQVFAPETLLPWLQDGEAPCWGREPTALLTMNTEAVVAAGSDGRFNGLIVQRQNATLRILGVVLQSRLSDAQLATLLRRAASGATTIQIFNEPENSPFMGRCLQLGFTEFFSQYEMHLSL